MKKILLILAVAICVAVAGTALAAAYNSANPLTGTLKADSSIILSLDDTAETPITLVVGSNIVRNIVCTVAKSDSANKTGTLTITLTNGTAPQSLDKVTVTLYSDSGCETPIVGKTQKGAGTITVTEINETTTFYAKISVDNDATAANVGGTLGLSFVVAD